ncbi:MAG: lysine--tRNA ligase [Deltaproteobacteria bacterium]|nr:lysine--tRNA ligase [Deltaproteobacteria bacterium]
MSELEDQIENRRQKKVLLSENGITPYPNQFSFDLEPSQVHELHGSKDPEDLQGENLILTVPGRITGLRKMGKISFLDLYDGAQKLQVLVRRNRLSEEAAVVLANLDLGDYVGARGQLQFSKTGELTVFAEDLTLLAKALRPLPEKWHGLTEVEARYRQRYLDLVANPESRRVFETRAALIRGLRRHLEAEGFLEVETPMMQAMAGGATARPFTTHHNALDLPLFLRIAPELYLKRLLVGGLHRVYEINRNFRNEGISTHHNPEFTMLEFYWAYSDYQQLMDFTEGMLESLAQEVLGTTVVPWQGQEIRLERPWQRFTMKDAITHFAKIPAERLETAEQLEEELKRGHFELPTTRDYGHLLLALFEATVEEHLLQPTFITDHPVEISPLAKQCPEDPRFTERFELYFAGMELANAFSELNDPEVQAERFHQQSAARDGGDDEAHAFDHDYVRALEHGMPPAGGLGLGIDRLTMIFTDRPSIRDVILFPLLRPEASRRTGPEVDTEGGVAAGAEGEPEGDE